MQARTFDIAPEFLAAAIESAAKQGWKLASAAAHDWPDPTLYHCVFIAAEGARGLDLILSAYAPIGK